MIQNDIHIFSERILLLLEIGKDFTIAIRWIDSHLKTGFVPTMTERFQFIDNSRDLDAILKASARI